MKSWVFYNKTQLGGEEKRLFLVDVYEGDIATFSTRERTKDMGYIDTLLDPSPKGLAAKIVTFTDFKLEKGDLLTSIRAPVIIEGETHGEFPANIEQIQEFREEYLRFTKT